MFHNLYTEISRYKYTSHSTQVDGLKNVNYIVWLGQFFEIIDHILTNQMN